MQGLSDIAVFVEVVEQRSFTAAAETLELSKAAVSKSVSRLEKRLGARLLNRTTRRLSLTEAGSALYERASGALSELASAESEVIELGGAPRGRLRVSAPTYFGTTFVMPAVGEFLERYPQIELEMNLDNRLVDLVEERFDLAIRITTLVSSSLVARRMAPVRLFTVASPAYLAHAGTPETPQDLAAHECILYTLDRSPSDWHFHTGRRGGAISVRVRGRLRCNSDEATKQAVLDGVGVTRFPELFVAEEIADGRLVRLLPGYEPPPASLCAVFPTRAQLPAKVRAFVDFLSTKLGSGALS